ncbi:UDP-N-acetylglucosamine 2-epimerase [Escherichia coli]|uniref:UDP-N-acetylglucosamine 2-epimerase n=1 Tax=Escherichia coli TaxID=562 RepID=UPI0028E16D96|nr:UDP-N-acetylglucosamine 2-epimerase [Escherichia coli]MDT9464806.1 UDP-N-acetylglucosamine 2-epimerase [Escherichia coli]
MKKILYVTGSRAEYGIMKRLLQQLKEDDSIDLSIVATGMHCDKKYGMTYKVIENDGFRVDKIIDIEINNDTNAEIIKTMSRCLSEFGIYFQDNKFDAVMILGDRYEIMSVALAAAMHNLPIIHFHGGEKTLGNYDEFIRHSITKMSSLHLASTHEYRKRIIQMGEHPSNVYDIGALGAENSLLLTLPPKDVLEQKFGGLSKPYFVVVFHPETLSGVSPEIQVQSLLKSLHSFIKKYNFVFIGSNSDTGSDKITQKIKNFCKENNTTYFVSILPEEYLALCKYSQGLIGNSSSGLIEVPSLGVPTVNIGDRQKGRVHGTTVINCECSTEGISEAIKKCLDEHYINGIKNAVNPYYKHNVMNNAYKHIKEFLLSNHEQYKDFYDVSFEL